MQVKAQNSVGASFANAKPTAVVAAAPAPVPRKPAAAVVAVSSLSLPDRLVVDRLQFIPTRVRSRNEPLVARFHVSEINGRKPVSGALVYAVGVPFNRLSTAPEAKTGNDGWATITFRVLPSTSLRKGNLIVIFVRARRPGDKLLAGVSTRRLVSVRVG